MDLLIAILFSSDPSSGFWLYACGALTVFLGVKMVISGIRIYSEAQKLKRAPVSPLNRASVGLVHARGKAVGGNRLTSPLTKVPCFYFQVQITKHTSAFKGGNGWTVVGKETERQMFFLDDGTARVLVDPQDAEYDVGESFRYRLGRASSRYIDPALGVAGPSDQDLLALVEPRWGKGKYLFSESCLPADRECLVLGNCSENPDSKDAGNRILITKGRKEQPFLISSKLDQQEEKSLRKKAAGTFATGVFAVALGILCLLMGAGIFFPIG
jgi:E3 Ubiquitin ligase